MRNTDPIGSRFRGPTPPPVLDKNVLKAAAEKASFLSNEEGPRLSGNAQKSYSNESKNTQNSREQ
ncbi:MAG: hypothetical protein KDB29_06470, partial [Planctomycetes bacterium]|nr:hypothetical protein [Planctomycetota bacterium]